MQKVFSPLLQISLYTFGYLYATSNTALAQVTSDGTVNTQVNQNGNVAEITGGQTRGGNLFHSFRDFSVNTGNEAFFNNATDISNIFSRVTGGNISNIDGLIRANGSANLFLINPAGILFGENARLDVGGSFYGSSASSILFEDGEFSATDLTNPPVLTINAPIGLGFRDNPGDITVRGDGQGTRTTSDLIDTNNALRIEPNKTFALAGGNLIFEDASVKTAGGRIELGSVGKNERISLIPVEEGLSFGYENVSTFQDIQLSRTTSIDASGLLAGNIQVQGKNITLTGNSQIEASTLGNLSNQNSSGIIKIAAIDTIDIDESFNPSGNISSKIVAEVYSEATGDGANINVSANNLILTNGGNIQASTNGSGNAGNVVLNIDNAILFDGQDKDAFFSGVFTTAEDNSTGNSGNINISTSILEVRNNAIIRSRTFAQGDAGNLTINAEKLSLNAGRIDASTFGSGAGGNLIITASEVELSGSDGTFPTSIFNKAIDGTGNAGNLIINTNMLKMRDLSQIDVGNFVRPLPGSPPIPFQTGKGASGSLNINANSIQVNNAIISADNANGVGGELEINTNSLTLENRASIVAETTSDTGTGGKIDLNVDGTIEMRDNSLISGQALKGATGGNVNIDANFIVAFPNKNSLNGNNDILANAQQGRGGNITINAESLFGIQKRIQSNLTNDIDASSKFSLDGNVNINTPDVNPLQGVTELPTNVVEPEQTTAQACQANRETAAKNGLVINGKGGIPATPDEPLTSQNLIVNGEVTSAYAIPEPIETSQGKIQLARGVIVKPSGDIILTAYPTNNAGERMPEIKPNCS